VAECVEFGWYSKRNPNGVGWVPCTADDPEAGPDLNRLYIEATWDPARGRFVREGVEANPGGSMNPPCPNCGLDPCECVCPDAFSSKPSPSPFVPTVPAHPTYLFTLSVTLQGSSWTAGSWYISDAEDAAIMRAEVLAEIRQQLDAATSLGDFGFEFYRTEADRNHNALQATDDPDAR
jgi:hypothetical protein